MILTAAEIASMRAEVLNTQLDMTCTITRRQAGTTDPYNQPTWTQAAHLTDIACHYWEAQERELQGEINLTITSEHLVLPANTDVVNTDQVTEITGVDGLQIAGPLAIKQVIDRLNHVELILEEINP